MTKKNTDKNVAGRTEPTTNEQETVETTALNTLKKVADSLGLKYRANITLPTLQEKMEDFLEEQKVANAIKANNEAIAAAAVIEPLEMNPQQKRMQIIKEATRLKRVAVTCMNPNKKDWEGEVFTVSNSVIPTQKKYVPFNAKPWHVPQIILNVMKERQCQVFKTVQRGKHKIREGYLIPEFSISELDPLSTAELEDLRKEQAMANRIG